MNSRRSLTKPSSGRAQWKKKKIFFFYDRVSHTTTLKKKKIFTLFCFLRNKNAPELDEFTN